MSGQTHPEQARRFEGRFLDGQLVLIFGNVNAPEAGYSVDVRSGELYRNGHLVGWVRQIEFDRDALGWWVDYDAKPFGPCDPRWHAIPADEQFLASARTRARA